MARDFMALSDTKLESGVAKQAGLEPVLPGSPVLRTVRSWAGEEWLEFRRQLAPRCAMAWGGIVTCYLMIAAALAALILVEIRWGNGIATPFWVQISATRPMHEHSLMAPLLAVTAAIDFLRTPFSRTAQMFLTLKRAD